MNNNPIFDDWFKTWPVRIRKRTRETLIVTPKTYEIFYKNHIMSLDILPDVSDNGNCILSSFGSNELTLDDKSKSDGEEKVGNIDKNQNLSLDSLLESLPLVYNPSTKQLHIVKLKSKTNESLESTVSNHLNRKVHARQKILKSNKDNYRSAQDEECELISKTEFNDENSCINIAHKQDFRKFESLKKLHTGDKTLNSSVPVNSLSEPVSFESGSSFSSSSTEKCCPSSPAASPCLTLDGAVQREAVTVTKKKKGITEFFTRNLFPWRSKNGGRTYSNPSECDRDSVSSDISSLDISSLDDSSASSWKIFSKGENISPHASDPKIPTHELPAGSAGLIMEERPGNLPSKTPFEQERHKQEYNSIVSAAKKREIKEAKERRRAQTLQLKQEKQLSDSVHTWNTSILPKWNTISLDKLSSLSVGKLVENEVKESNIESKNQESTLNLIQLDVSRTFPQLCIFQNGGPFHDPLHNILGAFVCYRPDIGYVQGMSFLAATLLLNMEESDAFIFFANLVTRPPHLAFFSVDQRIMQAYYMTFEQVLWENLPHLADHLKNLNVSPNMYFLDWVLTVFARSFPLDVAARMWDVYLRDGEEFLFRAAIGILKHFEKELLAEDCTVLAAQFLTRLPEDLCVDALFKDVASVPVTTSAKKRFKEVLETNVRKASNS